MPATDAPAANTQKDYKRSSKSADMLSLPDTVNQQRAPYNANPVSIKSDASQDGRAAKKAESQAQASIDAAAAAAAAAAAGSSGEVKRAFDRNGPVEAVALQSDWQFWNVYSDVRTIGKGHFAKVKHVLHNETKEQFAAKVLDKQLADNDIEDLVRVARGLPTPPHMVSGESW